MEPGGGEIRFEDLDLTYAISFDLGGPVEIQDLVEWLSSKKLVEGIWIPPSDEYEPAPELIRRKARELGIKDVDRISVEELMKDGKLKEEIDRALAMFQQIISMNRFACHSEYLELGRYARLKLADLKLTVEDPEFSYLGELRCELYLLLHRTGIGVVTAWIHLSSDLSTDNVIEIEKKLYNTKCIVEGPFGEIKSTLGEFIDHIIRPLQSAVVFSSEYGGFDKAADACIEGHITTDKLEEKLRFPYTYIYEVVCIRKYRCQDGCMTAEDAVERHLKEIAGILMQHGRWRYCRMDAAKEDLRKNLSIDVDHAMFMTIGISLFIGSTMLDEGLENVEDKELGYLGTELLLVLPVEFLQLSEMFLRAYISVYRRKSEELRERRERGERVRPSEVIKVREELMYGLEEYNNISVFAADPFRRIMEHGKERLRLSNEANVLIFGLQELSDMATTLYEEETLRGQEDLSRKQVILTILFGIFGAFQEMEFLEPKIGLLYAIAATCATFLLSYPIYKLYLFIGRRKKAVKSS
jgi:hypothetical protein